MVDLGRTALAAVVGAVSKTSVWQTESPEFDPQLCWDVSICVTFSKKITQHSSEVGNKLACIGLVSRPGGVKEVSSA